ncbi:nuclear transport factor 2 family protein [Fodinicola acaciae]|uniref:nuclear transport factor 2 family protein n=1 Tax=Fodinicola acaciae TaxID=2681555 RepID=UPI0013D55941|nr:nuclear transport factor 2 family protein [Fodinicola acaciae]
MKPAKQVTDEIVAIETEMWRANRDGDGAFYQRLIRDDGIVVSRYGVATKAQIVPVVSKNDNPYVKTDLDEWRVLQPTPDTAVVTYRSAVTTGAGVEFKVLATSVYAREADGWRSVFHQQTPLD